MTLREVSMSFTDAIYVAGNLSKNSAKLLRQLQLEQVHDPDKEPASPVPFATVPLNVQILPAMVMVGGVEPIRLE